MAVFVFTIDFPSARGNNVQEVIGDYPAAKTLDELLGHLQRGPRWILIMQHYFAAGKTVPKAGMIIDVSRIGKVKLFVPDRDDDHF